MEHISVAMLVFIAINVMAAALFVSAFVLVATSFRRKEELAKPARHPMAGAPSPLNGYTVDDDDGR